ncbi:MAG: hypothetical protein A2X84_06595 [Desulfuromonadaceae bacterium GWC2_58_13]|nr:MAG: hypothetical protein A2X84_06595 [Desulfuromonadaceae bacterium GWC2_58_13]
MKSKYLSIFLLFIMFAGPFQSWAAEYRATEEGLQRWLKANRDQGSGLPYSHVGDERFRTWTFTYDAAVVALAWLAVGEVAEAQRIVDFYRMTPEVWRLGGIIEAVSATGDGFVGRDWSVRSGANLWLGMASAHLYRRTGQRSYLDLARKIADFGISLQDQHRASPNFGGVSMGPTGAPANPKDQHFGYDSAMPAYSESYATEINIDAYALFGMLDAETGDARYGNAQALVLQWLKQNGFNSVEHRFNRGFHDPTVASDIQSWGVSALGIEVLDSFERDAAQKILRYVEANCLVRVTVRRSNNTEIRVEGVDFINHDFVEALKREPLISPEWTFQLANAWQRLSVDSGAGREAVLARKFAEKRDQLLQQMVNLAIPVGDSLAYPYATLPDALLGHENRTPAAGNLSAIGVAYGLLALRGFDPLVVPPRPPRF